MTYRFHATTLVAILFAAGTALAQTPPAAAPDNGHPDKAEMLRHFTEMCKDRQARATGELAFLEAKLALTDQQKPLFERWKKIKLAAAKAVDCTPPPDGEPSIVDGLKREEKLLRQHLDELKAELPALEALAASLTDEQKHAFAPPHRPPHQGGAHPGDDRPHGDHPPGDGDNEHGAPTPPPEH